MGARMTADRISELVAAGETETLEFKSTTGQRSDAAKTLCAMLNQRGGHVLFGVTPKEPWSDSRLAKTQSRG